MQVPSFCQRTGGCWGGRIKIVCTNWVIRASCAAAISGSFAASEGRSCGGMPAEFLASGLNEGRLSGQAVDVAGFPVAAFIDNFQVGKLRLQGGEHFDQRHMAVRACRTASSRGTTAFPRACPSRRFHVPSVPTSQPSGEIKRPVVSWPGQRSRTMPRTIARRVLLVYGSATCGPGRRVPGPNRERGPRNLRRDRGLLLCRGRKLCMPMSNWILGSAILAFAGGCAWLAIVRPYLGSPKGPFGKSCLVNSLNFSDISIP